MKITLNSKDGIVHDVVKKFDERSAVGFKKYGKVLREDSDSLYRWVNDVQEELMDAVLYLQKVKETLTELSEENYIHEYQRSVMEDLNKDEDDDLYWKSDSTGPISKYP